MGYAFISYSTKDQAMADAIRNTFTANKIDTWMAPYSIAPGSKYAQSITNAIRNCSCFVLLLSNASQASEAVDSEVELAALTFKKSIVTVQIENVILNDAFTFYIHNKQILPIDSVDVSTPAMQAVLSTVISFAGQTLIAQPQQNNSYNTANAAPSPHPATNQNSGASPYVNRPSQSPPPLQRPTANNQNNGYAQQPPQNGYATQQRQTPPTQNYAPTTFKTSGSPKHVKFGEAIKLFFMNYANFTGRSTASEYWFSFLFIFIVNLFTSAIPGIGAIISLAIFIPTLSVTVRRLHDTGKNWTYLLLGFIPFVGIIILIIQYCQPSAPDNVWGAAARK